MRTPIRRGIRLTALSVVAAIAGSNNPSFSQTTPRQIPPKTNSASSLIQDARLQVRLGLSATGITMQELCVRLAEVTQIPFATDAASRDLKFIVRCRSRNAREIMDAVAEIVPGKWEREPAGYVFRRDKIALNQKRTWWRLFEDERAAWRAGVVKQFSREIQDQFSLLDKPMPPSEEKFSAEDIEYTKMGYMAWRSLPYSAIEMVIGQVDDLALYQKFPMGTRHQASGGVFLPADSLSQETKRLLQANSARFSANVDANIKGVWLYSHAMNLNMNAVRSDGTMVSLPTSFGPPSVSNPVSVRLDQRFLAFLTQQFDARPPKGSSQKPNVYVQSYLHYTRPTPLWRRLTEFQLRPFWGEPQKDAPRQGEQVSPRLADQCDQIATDYKTDIIADYFSCPERLLTTSPKTQKKTLEKALEEITTQHDASSKTTPSGIVLLRNNRWYRDEDLEVTPALIAEITARKATLVTPSGLDKNQAALFQHLEMTMAALQKLTLWQIANGFRYYVDEAAYAAHQAKQKKGRAADWTESNAQPFADVAATIFAHYSVCRFYAALSPTEREKVITTGLPTASLNAEASRMLADLNITYRVEGAQAGKTVRLRSEPEGVAHAIMRSSTGDMYSDTFGNRTNGAAPFFLDFLVGEAAQ